MDDGIPSVDVSKETLLDWYRQTLLGEGMISAEDLALITVVNEPAQVVETIFDHYQTRAFEPSAREREMQFNL